ncbi:MAG: hypothetical protein KGK07_08330 [Chloroflexota bacterium]|nr:hypothetical protein [Chloroflexota bacterium]
MRARPASRPEDAPLRLITPGAGVETDISPRAAALLLLGALAVGSLVRASFVLSSGFPLNDGGMFVAMVRDLQASAYRLPAFTSYNAEHLPFAYPPLGFYLAGVLNDLTGASLTQVLRFVPLACSALAVPAFYLLAREMLRTRQAVAVAVWLFAFLPASIAWMIMGGGLTRAPGYLFAILTLSAVRRMYRRRTASSALLVVVVSSLAVLSHLEMAWFAAISAAVFLLAFGRDRRSLVLTAAAAAGVAALTAPWWLTVVIQHGPGPFLAAASSTSSSPWQPLTLLVQFGVTGETLFALTGALALLGIAACLATRQYLLPSWLLALAVFDQRGFRTSATVVVALLAAVAVCDVVLPLAAKWSLPSSLASSARHGPRGAPRWLAPAMLALALAYPAFSVLATPSKVLTGMSTDERAAMAWVRTNTPPAARFVVVSGDAWSVDRTSEWFPVLAGRRSLATVQGTEWLPGGAYHRRIRQYQTLQDCAVADAACLASWSAGSGERFDDVYIPRLSPRADTTSGAPCCAPLIAALRADPRYAVLYDGPGAVVFAHLAAGG